MSYCNHHIFHRLWPHTQYSLYQQMVLELVHMLVRLHISYYTASEESPTGGAAGVSGGGRGSVVVML